MTTRWPIARPVVAGVFAASLLLGTATTAGAQPHASANVATASISSSVAAENAAKTYSIQATKLKLAKPKGFKIKFTKKGVHLSWKKVKHATGYTVIIDMPPGVYGPPIPYRVKHTHKYFPYNPYFSGNYGHQIRLMATHKNTTSPQVVSSKVQPYVPRVVVRHAVVRHHKKKKAWYKRVLGVAKKCGKEGAITAVATGAGGAAAVGVSTFFPPAVAVTTAAASILTVSSTTTATVYCVLK